MKIILLALILTLSAGQLRAQRETSPYKPFAMFNGDTVSYMEFNYIIRSNQYKGWTVGEILKEMEFPALYIACVGFRASMHDNSPTKLASLGLGIKQTGKEPNELDDYYIHVRFENTPDLSEYQAVRGIGNSPAFTPGLYNFIKDLKIVSVAFNAPLIKDPELLEKLKRRRERYELGGIKAQEELERIRKSRQQ